MIKIDTVLLITTQSINPRKIRQSAPKEKQDL